MQNISFVILNYKIWKETAACVESILDTQKDSGCSIQIVIVDNGSSNESMDKLKERFSTQEQVHLISAEKNVGFAKGNNLGIVYAREHFNPDFIVAANSDILFEQKDYCKQLVNIYERKHFAILGGDIVDASRTQHFNPVAMERNYTLNYMRKQVLVSGIKALLFRLIKFFHLKKAVVGHYGVAENEMGEDRATGSKHLTTREVEGKSVAADSRMDEEKEGVLLHGCCLVFSKDFFRGFDGFYEETFLYAEEEILYYLAMKKGMKVLYSPNVTCMHKEAVSTNTILKDFCDKKIFYFSHITKSYRVFLKLMKLENR